MLQVFKDHQFEFLIGLIFIAALAVGIFGTLFFLRWRSRRSGTAGRKHGKHAELLAEKMLVNQGYHILERNPRLRSRLAVNRDLVDFESEPDFIVEKDHCRFVVEVKSGRHAQIGKAAVRRQILEYLFASGLPCILLMMPEGELVEIDVWEEDLRRWLEES